MRILFILAVPALAACDGYYGGTADEITFDRALGREAIERQATVSGAPGEISAIAFAREGGGIGGDVESYFAMSTIRDVSGTGAVLAGNATYDGTWAVAGWQEREVFSDTGSITLVADFADGTLTGVGNNGLAGEALGRLAVDGIFLGTAVGGEVTYVSGRFDASMTGAVDDPIGVAYALNSGLPARPSTLGADGLVLVFAGDRSDGSAPYAIAGGVVAEAVSD